MAGCLAVALHYTWRPVCSRHLSTLVYNNFLSFGSMNHTDHSGEFLAGAADRSKRAHTKPKFSGSCNIMRYIAACSNFRPHLFLLVEWGTTCTFCCNSNQTEQRPVHLRVQNVAVRVRQRTVSLRVSIRSTDLIRYSLCSHLNFFN